MAEVDQQLWQPHDACSHLGGGDQEAGSRERGAPELHFSPFPTLLSQEPQPRHWGPSCSGRSSVGQSFLDVSSKVHPNLSP